MVFVVGLYETKYTVRFNHEAIRQRTTDNQSSSLQI